MSNEYDVSEVTGATEWDAFAATAVGGTMFSTSRWLDCAQSALGGRKVILGCRRNGCLVAGVTGLETEGWGGRRLVTPDLTPHGGILCAPVSGKGPAKAEAEYHRAAGILSNHLLQEYGYVHLTHAPDITDLRPFAWSGWNVRPRYTYWLDLADLDALWERIERRTRTAIRKAERAGYRLRAVSDLELLEVLYARVYQGRHSAPPVAAAGMRRFAEAVMASGLGEAWASYTADGRPAAVVVFVHDNDFVHDNHMVHAWVAGADQQMASSGASPYLYWQFFQQTDCHRFDFVGANVPGIAKFKRGFGGQLVPYYAAAGFGSAWLRTAYSLRDLVYQLRNV